jgi:hypothetical protein
MAQVLLPQWTAIPIGQHLRDELDRRANNYGIKYTGSDNESYNPEYKGPMSPWIRCVSNTIIRNKVTGFQREGFVLNSGKTLDERYGIHGNKQIIGYDIRGNPHEIDNHSDETAQPFRPPPAIIGIDVKIKQDLYRFVTIRWNCYSLDQMNYMSYYFFTPKNTILLEWGWNNFNRQSLVDISEVGKFADFDPDTGKYRLNEEARHDEYENMRIANEEDQYAERSLERRGIRDAFSNPDVFEQGTKISGGNYDGMVAQITSFGYTFNQATLAYECVTEISSNSKYYMGLAVRNLVYITDKKDDTKIAVIKEFKEYWEKEFPADIKSAYTDSTHRIRGVLLNGRAFIPSEYFNKEHNAKKVENSNDVYVSLGLFIEVLSQFIPSNNAPGINTINIEDVNIGAHMNMISTHKDVLIPNIKTPVYIASNLLGDTSENTRKFIKNKDDTPLQIADKLMMSVLNNEAKDRVDLNDIINYKRTGDKSQYAFPSINDTSQTNDSQKYYRGKLTNLYISLELIKTACNGSDIKEVLKIICDRINEALVVTQLNVVASDNNTIKIIDSRFTDLTLLKESMKVIGVNSILYFFDVNSQYSVTKGFKFDVKISDAIANTIMMSNQSNTQGILNQTINNRLNFNVLSEEEEIRDIIVDEMNVASARQSRERDIKEENQKKQALGENYNKDIAEAKKAREADNKKNIENIDASSLYYTLKDGSKIHMILPDTYKAKYQAMLADDSPLFTNISNTPIPGTTAEFMMEGIGGFKTFQVFGVKFLPKPYQNNIVFKIKEIQQTVTENVWSTTIISVIMPARDLQNFI